jgi:CubicO group peptidase (beta-lactamase class C family)
MSAIDAGMDPSRLERVIEVIAADVAAERYDGAVILAARHGQIALHEAVGFAERASAREARLDDVFYLFSITKTFTASLVLQCADRGDIRLNDPVADVIPEFAAKGKQRVTFAQLLSHTGGMPSELPYFPIDKFGHVETIAMAVADQSLSTQPGHYVSYSAIGAFAVLGEVVRRLDGGTRPLRDIMAAELFEPLGMRSASLSLRPDIDARRVPAVVRDRTPGIIPPAALESINGMMNDEFEFPGGGAMATAEDMFRWTEVLRRGGELDGHRILSQAMVEFALSNHTGPVPNHIFDAMCERRGWDPYPANLGLGFFLRGEEIYATPFGLTSSPGTFGGLGSGSTVFWVDPERDLSFVCLTSGALEDSANFERMQKLSDLVLAAVVD